MQVTVTQVRKKVLFHLHHKQILELEYMSDYQIDDIKKAFDYITDFFLENEKLMNAIYECEDNNPDCKCKCHANIG